MKRIKTSNPNIIGWKRGGGILALFGLPFLIAGLLIMSVPISGVEVEGNMPEWALIPFGGVFALVGLGLVFGRTATILNRSERKLITWWGLLIPFSSKERKLYDFEKVTLTKEVRQSDKSTYTVYPIRLDGRGKPGTIGETKDYNESRKVAEIHLLMLAAGLIFPTIVFFVFLQPILNTNMPDEFSWIFVGFIIIFFILFPIFSILGVNAASAMKKWRVVISPASVKVEERSISVRTHELPTDEIEELELSPCREGPAALISVKGVDRGGILLRSDKKTLCFGGHLPEPELQYLHGLIRSIITS